MSEKEKYCVNCKCKITGIVYLKCLDNFLQHKYFDTEEENVFCSQDCFCEYMMLEQIDNENYDFDFPDDLEEEE